MFKLGTNSIGKVYLGSTEISLAYLGSDLVYNGGSTPPAPKEYIDVYKKMFPANGLISSRNNFIIYLKETVANGTDIHVAFTLSNVPDTVTNVTIRTASSPVATIETVYPPLGTIDVEATMDRNSNMLYVYFSETVSGVQVSSMVVEKII